VGVAATPATYTTTINTVPIGLLMTVTPQISESGEVILNTRPTISRITGYATDPNPVLAENRTINRIPEVQTREMESVLRVQSGGVAILGGLMQDSRDNKSDEVPGLNQVPLFGNLFKYRDEASKKTELVIFLRPTVVQDAPLEGDFRDYRTALQDARDAMDAPSTPARPELQFLQTKP
jgi:general secretion pathway protein D